MAYASSSRRTEVRGPLAAEPAFDCGNAAGARAEQQLSHRCERWASPREISSRLPRSASGDETPWLGHVTDAIADGLQSVTGDVTYADAAASLARGRPLIVLAGTGRSADAIAAARSGEPADPRAVEIAAPALTRVVHLREAAPALQAVLNSAT
jgi:hypothetical protein